MHLASISSQEENDKLEKYIKDNGKNTLDELTVVKNLPTMYSCRIECSVINYNYKKI